MTYSPGTEFAPEKLQSLNDQSRQLLGSRIAVATSSQAPTVAHLGPRIVLLTCK
jgi:hypothetical protein